ncbi:MAG: hypothetical protein NT019_00155 [Candidatus Adlerbacteria bacterium]|nr:hypothetical protein [Candidatus Adlerbacteria bacterium]
MLDIATLSDNLDAAAKFFRVMNKVGINAEQLMLPVNDKKARDNLAAFLQAGCPTLPPPVFERNEHGHIVLTIKGLDLTGGQEVERLLGAKYRVGDYAKSCLTSTKPDSYDAKHRLVAGQKYKIALVPHKEIKRDADRTTEALQKLGTEKYGYGKPLAGVIPRIRESVSDKQMEKMGFWYIVALYDTIQDSGGNPRVLISDRGVDGSWVDSSWVKPGCKWGGNGASAFLVPASA